MKVENAVKTLQREHFKLVEGGPKDLEDVIVVSFRQMPLTEVVINGKVATIGEFGDLHDFVAHLWDIYEEKS